MYTQPLQCISHRHDIEEPLKVKMRFAAEAKQELARVEVPRELPWNTRCRRPGWKSEPWKRFWSSVKEWSESHLSDRPPAIRVTFAKLELPWEIFSNEAEKGFDLGLTSAKNFTWEAMFSWCCCHLKNLEFSTQWVEVAIILYVSSLLSKLLSSR